MKKYKWFSVVIMNSLVVTLFLSTACANSSWHWISETRPYDVLPFVATGTLIIETLSINIIPRIRKPAKVFCVVTIANLLSFAAPYLLCLVNQVYAFKQALNNLPIFTVGLAYLFLTIVVEIPIVFYFLKKDTQDKKSLLWTAIGSNVFTTILVAVVERTLCYGHW